jgi:hypothetical protein
MDLFELAEARNLRDKGIASVMEASEDFKDYARVGLERWLRMLPVGHEFISEEFRSFYTEHGLGPAPKHFNAWGALWNWAVKRGIVEPVGRLEQTTRKSRHAQKMQVYRKPSK